jgi:aromatic ring hydroxylase
MMGARTGREYIDSLCDGRQVWQAGRRIADVPTHPGFVGTVGTLARLYDLQHTLEHADTMTAVWEGERISYSYLPPTTPEQLAGKCRNSEFWAAETLGYMGRLPDFCANLVVGLLDIADMLGQHGAQYAENARSYHRFCAQRDLCLTHALNDQFYDRSKRIAEQDDPAVILRVVRETPEGPIVRGLRNLATLAPVSDEVLVYPNRPRAEDEADYALVFALPMNAPGLVTICRDLYAEHADPERLPLSARFDEVDATLIFDDVLVPWERVFVYRNPALASRVLRLINQLWAAYATLIRLVTKLEVFVGVADLLSRWSGRETNKPTQVLIGQLVADLQVMRACVRAAEVDAYRTPSGHLAPRTHDAYRLHGQDASDRAERAFEDVLTSYLILTTGASDLSSREIGQYVERFCRAKAPSTRDHLRLLAVAADMVQSAFGGRSQLYERFYSGEPDAMRQRLYTSFDRSAPTARLLRFIRDQWEQAPLPAGAQRE